MNTTIKSFIATLITTFTMHAEAASLTVACFNDNGDGLYFGYESELKQFIYSFGNDSCIATPDSGWSWDHSSVDVNIQANSVDAVTQIVTGDVITPMFECNSEVKVAKNSDGDFILQKGTVWLNGVKNKHSAFIGARCYVQ